MLKNLQFRGYALALVATLAMSNVFIFSKAALNVMNLYQFGFYWFGFAILWHAVYAIPTRRYKEIRKLSRSSIWALVMIGLLELGGTSTFFIALNVVENPTIVAFLVNLTPLFVTVLGLLFLKERFSLFEGIGFILTLSGAFIISYTKEASFSGVFISGTGFIILSCFLLALGVIAAKKFIKDLDPGLLAVNRVFYLFTLAVILVIVNRSSLVIPRLGLINVIIGSFVGPFLTAYAHYTSLKYIEASRSTIIQSSKSLFVLIGAYLYFNIFPETVQVIGGVVTIIGVLLVTLGKQIGKK